MESLETQVDIAALASVIKPNAFKIVTGVFFGLALLSVAGRVAARLYTRLRLGVDDYLLFAAAVFLSGSIGIMYRIVNKVYFWTAVRNDPSLAFRIKPEDHTKVSADAMAIITSFMILSWTAIFLVKASFLAFFKQLIWQVGTIQRYYWVVVGITVVSWIIAICEPFIVCPKFGTNVTECIATTLREGVMIGVITVLDVLTDILIASIPVILLRRSSIRPAQRILLLLFMCLSMVMCIVSIVRYTAYYGKNGLKRVDMEWIFFWQALEANIAIIMSSLTVFRTLLTYLGHKRAEERRRIKAAEAAAAAAARPRSNLMSSLSGFMRRSRTRHAEGTLDMGVTGDLESQDVFPGGADAGSPSFTHQDNRTTLTRAAEEDEKLNLQDRSTEITPSPTESPVATDYVREGQARDKETH